MLTPPEGLPDQALISALARHWDVEVASLVYRPVGFGSHHWEVRSGTGRHWFVTVDDLEAKRISRRDPLDAVFQRLRAALTTACDLHRSGRTFAVAPIPTLDGEALARVGDRFGVALYPFVDGESFAFGEFSSPAHRRAALDLVLAVHTAPDAARRNALVDDFAIPLRAELEAALQADDGDSGPYAREVAQLITRHAGPIRALLARYDELVAAGRTARSRRVLTHGEPHPGNTMRTPRGWVLIDWDTALVAPPERDLWHLDPGDGSVLAAYADITGVVPQPPVLELFRIRWDLADLAIEVDHFRRPHTAGSEDKKSWEILRALVTQISA